ncbi:MAG: PEP-CTERM sorting domain-containing protein [Gemmatimonadaceae bacterium]|nr:PEP-CTERM sorting domain-containing protein [Gemmatimonadaceae bacterium]
MLVTRSTLFAGAVAGLLLTSPARVDAQSLITTPNGTFATFFAGACPSGHCLNPGPVSVGTGGHVVTMSSTTSNNRISTGTHQVGSNGYIEGDIWAAITGSETAIFFDFESPVTSVGAFMTYNPDQGIDAPVLGAWNGSVFLGSWNLAIDAPINTPGGYNQFEFRGIEYAGGITRFGLAGGNLATKDLRVSSESIAVVPEPSTLALFGMGSLGLVMLQRRRRHA